MGFLDRLVADVIARETGLPVRRLVRRAGVGKLVAAGGLLAAGAAAVDWMQRQSAAGAPAAGVPPTLPPLPALPTLGLGTTAPLASQPAAHSERHGPNLTTLPPPPRSQAAQALPPLPTAAPPASPSGFDDGLEPSQRFVLARTVIAAALADGRLLDAERHLIETHLDEANDLGETERERLRRDLVVPATVNELAVGATSPATAVMMYRAGALVVAADGVRGTLESAWLTRLAEALRIDATTARRLENDLLSQISPPLPPPLPPSPPPEH